MREETSPPPDPERATLEPPANSGRPSSRLRLKQQGSSQGSMDSNSPLSLSRGRLLKMELKLDIN
jgi:hypothetical protein